jgi:hypothetical protein
MNGSQINHHPLNKKENLMNKILSALILALTVMLAKTVQSISGDPKTDQNAFQGNRVRSAGAGPRK